MHVFGLTPLDTALSVLGLNFSQMLMDYIFKQSSIGILLGVVAYFLIFWNLARKGQYGRIWVYVVSIFTLVVLLLPSQSLNDYKSAQESYGQSSVESKDIKEALIRFDKVPVIFTYVNQGIDSYVFAMIAIMDKILPEHLRFLDSPYQIQKVCLYIREGTNVGFQDKALRATFKSFILQHYMPAWTRLQHDAPTRKTIQDYYSKEEKKQWQKIERDIDQYFENDPNLKQASRQKLSTLLNISNDDLKQLIIRSYAEQSIGDGSKLDVYPYVLHALNFLPVLHGLAQMSLAVIFPFVILAFIISSNTAYLFHYIINFVWVKSWALLATISSYVSIYVGRTQANTFEYPYFCVVFVGVFFVLIILSRVVFIKGGRV